MNMAEATGPGWQARLALQFGLRATRTRLLKKCQYGPLTLQRTFYPEGDTCHGYILHPPGGVVSGDSLCISVEAQQDAHCLLTTPGATKFYRAGAQRLAHMNQRITVQSGAVLEWLPQQNIFFAGAHAALATAIDIAAGGRYVGWEINSLGRPANAETFDSGSVRSATRVTIAGDLRLAEQLHINSPSALHSASGMRGFPLLGSLIAAPCLAEHKDALEQILQDTVGPRYVHPIGVTLVDEVLVIRALGEQCEPVQRLFTQLWTALRQHWLQRAPCIPRIWST